MKTITRRTALAAPVTLPLLPVSAFAAPADPAVEAYRTASSLHLDPQRRWVKIVNVLNRVAKFVG